MNIKQSYVTKNSCYLSNRKIEPKGIMLHSIGVGQPNAKNLVNNYNNPTLQACVHAFIDANNGDIYQTLPWNHRGWHCASGKNGSGNNTHIGVEMCEPAYIKYTGGSTFTVSNLAAAQQQAKIAYDAAVELFAFLCKQYNLNPLKDGVIISHKEGFERGIASNHGDPEHLWKGLQLPYTMNKFRQDVYNKLHPVVQKEEEEEMTQEQFNQMMDNYIANLSKKSASTWATNEMNWAVSQGLIAEASQMPKKFLTREEMVTILHRFKDKFVK